MNFNRCCATDAFDKPKHLKKKEPEKIRPILLSDFKVKTKEEVESMRRSAYSYEV